MFTPKNFLPPVFEHCCSCLWGDSQGLITCLYFCFCREATSHFPPLVNTVYFCTSFKIYFFCFSSFLRHILDRFLFPGAVYQVVPVLAVTQRILIKSSWWSVPLRSFPGVRKTEVFRMLSSSVLGWILHGCYLQKGFSQSDGKVGDIVDFCKSFHKCLTIFGFICV